MNSCPELEITRTWQTAVEPTSTRAVAKIEQSQSPASQSGTQPPVARRQPPDTSTDETDFFPAGRSTKRLAEPAPKQPSLTTEDAEQAEQADSSNRLARSQRRRLTS